MRRRWRVVSAGIAAAAALVLPAGASASHDQSGAPFGEDFVLGEAFYPSGSPNPGDDIRIGVDAQSGAQGESASGFASISLRQSFLGGPVTCLAVRDNRATIVGEAPIVFASYIFVVEDNASTGTPDRFGADQINGPPATTCSTDVPGVTTTAITSGDLVVHDARPFPTSKDQCKNGGWRNYGTTFKNQGDCVSFVATGGTKRPAS